MNFTDRLHHHLCLLCTIRSVYIFSVVSLHVVTNCNTCRSLLFRRLYSARNFVLFNKLLNNLATIPRFPRETMHFLSCKTFIGNWSNRSSGEQISGDILTNDTSVGYLYSAE